MSAPVVHFEVSVHRGATGSPVGAARGAATAREGALLTLVDACGAIGQGEASPLAGHSAETLDAAVNALLGVRSRVLGRTLVAPRRLLLSPAVRSLPGSARFALETAVFDLVARRRGVALHALLAGGVDAVPASAYVGAALDPATPARALAAVAEGFTALKVKLVGAAPDFDREIDALRALRGALPRASRLRLDANGAWSLEEAPGALRRLAGLRVELVEQPTPVGLLRALGPCAVPWAIDESLDDPGDTAASLRRGSGCVAAVVKPAVHGLLGALAFAERARRVGRGAVVTHFFDGPVGTAAACELALAVGETRFAAGLARHPGLDAWPPALVPQLVTAGRVTASVRPGHGVDALSLSAALRVEG